MRSGLRTLHDIDRAIAKARKAVTEASAIPGRTAKALAEVQRKRATAYEQLAKDRLDIIQDGAGGDLGRVDREAAELLESHVQAGADITKQIEKNRKKIEAFESDRRNLEADVAKAVDDYDKAAAAAEAVVLQDPYYMTQLDRVEAAEFITERADMKLQLAQANKAELAKDYLKDPFFRYLQKRRFGTKQAKGWFLTQWLDHGVARISAYKKHAANFKTLSDLPEKLSDHLEGLEAETTEERDKLEKMESEILRREGVTKKHKASLAAQKKLDGLDEKIAATETAHQSLLDDRSRLNMGDSGPYREAAALMSDALKRKDLPNLRRLASQTRTRADDQAVKKLKDLSRLSRELRDDESEARQLVKKYKRRLSDLEKVRRRFKNRRYDAPSSVFEGGSIFGAVLGQALEGLVSGEDLWRQIERAQRTYRRYSDNDFGGRDWTEGLRLPRQTKYNRSSRRRTSIPRSPRQRLPKSYSKGRGGGFKTGGGF